MISIFVTLFLTLFSQASESVGITCTKFSLICPESGNCVWSAPPGQVYSIALNKSGESNSYETWEGSLDVVLEQQKVKISVYQRRKDGNKFDYIVLDIPLSKDVLLSATGGQVATVKHHDKAKKQGISVRCLSGISTVPN